MANRPAPALVLRLGDREELERWTRSSTVPASAAKRARIVLLAADGTANTRIAELVDATVTTVLSWRKRYQAKGLEGLSPDPPMARLRLGDRWRVSSGSALGRLGCRTSLSGCSTVILESRRFRRWVVRPQWAMVDR